MKAVGECNAGNPHALFDEGVLVNFRILLYPRGKRMPIGEFDQGDSGKNESLFIIVSNPPTHTRIRVFLNHPRV